MATHSSYKSGLLVGCNITEPSTAYKSKQRLQEDTIESGINLDAMENSRELTRTPSPTPSEHLALTGMDSMKSWRYWTRKERIPSYIALIVFDIIAILIVVKRVAIINFLEPATQWLHETPGAWLIPIAILVVLSCPPLFGHEIVAMICGVTWGIWIGFGITAAGTILGELLTFLSFQYCCFARTRKVVKSMVFSACLAQLVRRAGLKAALVIRLSFIPSHFTTVVFAASDMNVFVFVIAALLSSPKQMFMVYLGVALAESARGDHSLRFKITTVAVLVVGTLIGMATMYYIVRYTSKVKPEIIYERRKERQRKLQQTNFSNGTA